MFLHAADRGQKEAEWMVHWGHCGSVYDHSSEANQSAMELVGYHTSQREMRDIYQSIYLLWRVPGSPPCGAQPRRRAIQDILSSLKSQLHRCGCSSTGRNLESQDRQVESNWHDSYEEGLRAACQRALDTTEALGSDLERLHWQRRDRSWSCSQSRSHSRTRDCSRNCSWSESHFRTRSQSRSHSRARSQHHPQGHLRDVHPVSPEGPLLGRRVTFRNPEVDTSPERDTEGHSMKPSVSNIERCLEWQANQLGTPTWWMELQAIPCIRDPLKLAQKIRASFYIREVRMRALQEPGYTVPPTPKSLDRNAFLPNDLSYQDVWKKLALLTVAYAQSLQYWAEKQSPPKRQNLHSLAESDIKLWEAVKEYVTFTHWDIIWGLETEEESHTTIFSRVLSSSSEDQKVGEAATYSTHLAAKRDTTECIAPSPRIKVENPCLLLVTVSVVWLNLGSGVDTTGRTTTVGNTFQNPWMAATFLILTRTVCYGDSTIQELNE